MTVTARPTHPELSFAGGFDPYVVRDDFPILSTTVNGKPLVYLDSASTSQKPNVVIEAVDTFYREYNANVHRGIYTIGERSTAAYERARATVARFINALERNKLFFIVDGVQLGSEQSGGVKLQIKVETYSRTT